MKQNVALFIACYMDAFEPEVGIATLDLLEKLGCKVDYPFDQTCCSQPMTQRVQDQEHRAALLSGGRLTSCGRAPAYRLPPSLPSLFRWARSRPGRPNARSAITIAILYVCASIFEAIRLGSNAG
jgi:hypothetical protein